MKACFFHAFGGPEVLQYGDLPDPVPAAGEGVDDIPAASVNAATAAASFQPFMLLSSDDDPDVNRGTAEPCMPI